MDYCPKVLVINGQPFNKVTATGYCARSLFTGWPKERIRQIYTVPMAPDLEICTANWRLSQKDSVLYYPLRLFQSENRNGAMEWPKGHAEISGSSVQRKSASLTDEILRKIRLEASVWSDLFPYRINSNLAAWLDEYRPEIVYYSISSRIRHNHLAAAIASRYRIPAIPHVMDNWWDVPYLESSSGFMLRPILRSSFRRALRRIPLIVTVSEKMSAAFEPLFGVPCHSFMNCMEDALIDKLGQARRETSDITLAVIGNLSYGRVNILNDLATSVSNLKRNQPARSVSINVYTHSSVSKDLENTTTRWDFIKVQPSCLDDELADVFEKNALMVHLEDFEASSARYFQYSLTGKLPVYLASGRPILAYGPADSGTCSFLRNKGCGVVVGTRNTADLATAITGAIDPNGPRDQLVRRAFTVLNSSYRQSVVTACFRRLLADPASRRFVEDNSCGPLPQPQQKMMT